MTMAAASTNAQPASLSALRVALIVVAAIATLGAIADFPIAFHDFGHKEPLLVFAQRVTSAKLMIAPLVAGTALTFAALDRLRYAIMTLAALMLLAWASDLPTFPIHGLELSLGTTGAMTFIERFAFPLLAVAAIVLAIRGTQLVLATVFVTLPMILTITGVVLFAIGIAIHGF